MTQNNFQTASTSSAQAIWEKIQKGTFIIAEAGKNFIQTEEEKTIDEYLTNAKQLVDEAVKNGADAIKFQTHNVEDEVLNIDFDSPHFKGGKRYQWVSRNQKATPVNEFWLPLKKYCEEKGIIFFSTPMSCGAAKILNEQVGVNLWKIGSGDILDFVMLDYIRNTGKPIIISSGMSTLEEVEKAINFLKEKNDKVALLHCVSKYPCPPEELYLGTINFLKEKFFIKDGSGGLPIGFSDHSIGVEADRVAIALGATVIEKHFSMSRDLWGSDHKVSMTPAELKELVDSVREIENNEEKKKEILATDYAKRSMSVKEKILQEGEAMFRPLFRKSLMAGQDIPAGTVITANMLHAMRPQQYAGGLPSEHYEAVIGKKVVKDLKKYDPITETTLA